MLDYKELDEGMEQYFKSLEKFKPLSKEEERKLLIDYKLHKDVNAKNKLIEANLKYTCKLVKSFCGNGLTYSELLSEANDGLILAIKRYDLSKDVKLISYSKHWSCQKMRDAIRRNKKYISLADIHLGNGNDEKSSDMITDDDIKLTYIDKIDNESDEEFNETLDSVVNEKEYVKNLLEVLTEREREIFTLKYGINGKKKMSLADIAKIYGITRERVRQIMETGMKKLRCEAMTSSEASFADRNF